MGGDSTQDAGELRALYEAKVRAELAAADALAPGADTVRWSGDPLAPIAAVKGLPGPAEATGGEALSGADGEAFAKALYALGWPDGRPFATVARPVPDLADAARVARLRLQLEAVDPRVVIALDAEAAADVVAAYSLEAFAPGSPVVAGGRRFVALSGFEQALGDERAKRAVWQQLKHAAPDGPVY